MRLQRRFLRNRPFPPPLGTPLTPNQSFREPPNLLLLGIRRTLHSCPLNLVAMRTFPLTTTIDKGQLTTAALLPSQEIQKMDLRCILCTNGHHILVITLFHHQHCLLDITIDSTHLRHLLQRQFKPHTKFPVRVCRSRAYSTIRQDTAMPISFMTKVIIEPLFIHGDKSRLIFFSCQPIRATRLQQLRPRAFQSGHERALRHKVSHEHILDRIEIEDECLMQPPLQPPLRLLRPSRSIPDKRTPLHSMRLLALWMWGCRATM